MNKLTKISLTALGGALVASSAYAAALDASGSVGITMTGQEQTNKGNQFSMTDTVTFKGSGELDNGWTVTGSFELDDNAVAQSGRYMDSRSIKIEMGDGMGTLTFSGHGGSGAMSAKDDVMPTAYGESWDILSGDTGAPGGPTGNNMFNYTNEIADGMQLTIGYVPSGSYASSTTTSTADGSIDYGIEYTGMEGATLGIAHAENSASSTNEIETTTAYIKYATGGFTIGAQVTEQDHVTANSDVDFSAFGVSYAVSDDLSISLGQSTIETEVSTDEDQEMTAISFSYTMGSMTLAGSYVDGENLGGTATTDQKGYEIDLAFAF